MLLQTSMTSLNALIEAAKIVETKRDQRVSNALKDIAYYGSPEDPLRRRPGGAGTREIHNKLEKNRRAHLKECFEKLRTHIPSLESKKASNLGILSGAFTYIEQLKEQDRKHEEEWETLSRRKIRLQERLRMLASDIQTQLLQQQLFAQVQREKLSTGPTIVIVNTERSELQSIQTTSTETKTTNSETPPVGEEGNVDVTST